MYPALLRLLHSGVCSKHVLVTAAASGQVPSGGRGTINDSYGLPYGLVSCLETFLVFIAYLRSLGKIDSSLLVIKSLPMRVLHCYYRQRHTQEDGDHW